MLSSNVGERVSWSCLQTIKLGPNSWGWVSGPRTLEYMDVPHSLFKCNFSAGTMSVNVKYSPVPGAWQRFLAILSLVRCYAVHLGSIENINKWSSGAPASYYFCQNEKLYSERVNSYLKIFYRHLFFVFTVRQKIFPPCKSKTGA
jgi:hypothetical protein